MSVNPQTSIVFFTESLFVFSHNTSLIGCSVISLTPQSWRVPKHNPKLYAGAYYIIRTNKGRGNINKNPDTFSSGIPCSDLNISPVSGCLSSDAASSCSCKLSYLGISCAPSENVNPPSSQGSQSLPCNTTSSGPSISALPAYLSSDAFVSPCKLAHFGLCPAYSSDINPAHCGNINPAHIGDTVYRLVACTL